MYDQRDVLFEIVNDYPETRKVVRLETLKDEENLESLFSPIVKKIDALDPMAQTATKISSCISKSNGKSRLQLKSQQAKRQTGQKDKQAYESSLLMNAYAVEMRR